MPSIGNFTRTSDKCLETKTRHVCACLRKWFSPKIACLVHVMYIMYSIVVAHRMHSFCQHRVTMKQLCGIFSVSTKKQHNLQSNSRILYEQKYYFIVYCRICSYYFVELDERFLCQWVSKCMIIGDMKLKWKNWKSNF